MTLLVRDEVDIVEKNICFHLNNGVDFIVAMDNGSVDGTEKILEKYKKLGFLDYRINNDHTWLQDIWVSELAKRAKEKFNATHVFHCDADEFWYSKYGNLKKNIRNIDVMYVPVVNYLPPFYGKECVDMFENFSYIVEKTILCPGESELRKSSELLMYEYPRKLFTKSRFVKVGRGNDSLIEKNKFTSMKIDPEELKIFHFPIRSYKKFEKKVKRSGESYEKNNTPENIGWHIKSWYKIYKNGNLIDEYKKISLENVKQGYIKKGIIKKVMVPKEISNSIYIFEKSLDCH